MLKRIFPWVRRFILVLAAMGLSIIFLPRVITGLHAADLMYSQPEAPADRVAIIFGAGLRYDGTPTAMLRDRVSTGADLYFSGQVERLLMSGDNRFVDYNEPEAMRQYALYLGVPHEAIVLDYAGRRTYDTCYRARVIFGVDSALLVTQRFHLPRALFLCNMLGLDALGVETTNCYWTGSPLIWDVREQFATIAAFRDLYVRSPALVLGLPEPIFAD